MPVATLSLPPPSEKFAQLSALPLLEVGIVEALTLSGVLHIGRLALVLRRRKLLPPAGALSDILQPMLDGLAGAGWVKFDAEHGYRVPTVLQGTVLLYLLQSGDVSPWLAVLRDNFQRDGFSVAGEARQLLWAALKGETDAARSLLHTVAERRTWMTLPVLDTLSWLDSSDGILAFHGLRDDVQVLLLGSHFNQHNWGLAAGAHAYAYAIQRLGSGYEDWPDMLRLLLDQAVLRGDTATLERLAAYLPPTTSILFGLLSGAYAEVADRIDAGIQWLKKETNSRKVDVGTSLRSYHMLALLGCGSAEQRVKLRRLVREALKEEGGPTYLLLAGVLEQVETGVAHGPWTSITWRAPLHGMSGLLQALAAYWCDAPETHGTAWQSTLENFRERMQLAGYATVAQEIDLLLSRQFGQALAEPDWHQQRGWKPLVQLHERKEAWQYALHALASLKSGVAASSSTAERATRLIWMLARNRQGLEVHVREQKRSVKGLWSKGRQLSLSRLLDPAAETMATAQEQQLIDALRHNNQYRYAYDYAIDAADALPHLIGHPLVFWDDAPDVRVEVVEAQPALYLKERKQQIQLSLLPKTLRGDSAAVVEEETPTRVKVYRIGPEIRQIAAIVGSGLTVPADAKEHLVAAIAAIAPVLAVHSEVPDLGTHIDTIDADTKLYAHLLPYNAGLLLQFLVRPLTSGGWYRPGTAPELVMGEHEGRPLQARRHLGLELRAWQSVQQRCPALTLAEADGQQWLLEQPQACLEVLSELQALPMAELECVWPEGERYRIKGQRSAQQLRMGIKQQGDWFVASGELQLDDGQVIQLRQLLDILRTNPGRFLKLNDHDWLALSDTFRKRLDELALVADHSGKHDVRVTPLAAPLLQDLATEVGEFHADQAWQGHIQRLQSLQHYQPQLPSTLQAELRDYQREGYVWLSRLARWGVGACLADDMGLGKTVQALALLLDRAPAGAQLVVAPTSVVLNWCAEAAKFAPTLRVRRYHEQRTLDDLGAFDLVLTSYGLLQQDAEAFAAIQWRSVVLDEAQAIKNSQTKRSQAAMALQADFKLIASGTPVENHLGELWNLFRFINPALLGSQERFNERFALPIERGDRNARQALKRLLQPFILRRTKTQVLDELPERTEITLKVPLSAEEAHVYEALRQQAVDSLSSDTEAAKPMQVLAEITRLRRFCCNPRLVLPDSALASSKLAAFADIMEELLANRHKALVFSQFVDHLAIVRAWLDEQKIAYQYLDGSTLPAQRQQRVNAFQAGDGDVFLISLKAGGTGLNLTAADYVIHLDPWWNPAVEDQASDRAHRMGQSRPVTIYRLVAEHTIEEQIVALHAEKRDLADSLLEGGEVSAKLTADALLGLLRGS